MPHSLVFDTKMEKDYYFGASCRHCHPELSARYLNPRIIFLEFGERKEEKTMSLTVAAMFSFQYHTF